MIHSRVIGEARNRLWWHWFKWTASFLGTFLLLVVLLAALESRQMIVRILDIPNPEYFYIMEPVAARFLLIAFMILTALFGVILVPRSVRKKEQQLIEKIPKVFEDV